MSVRIPVRLAVIAALVGGSALAIAFDGGAPTAKTAAPAIGGKPAEGLCTDCHNDFVVNSGGMVELVGAPSYYQPGTQYTFSVRITSSQSTGNPGRIWGFELTAVRMSDGTGAGTFANVSGQGTQIATGSGQFSTRKYIQVSSGNQVGAVSPVTWQVQWTAPAVGVGSIGFFAGGIVADGDGGTGGDWVYAGSTLAKDVTPSAPLSWGRLKTIYH